MTVGTHTVKVYADRAAADWSAPINANPYFTNNIDTWKAQPWVGGPWRWEAGQAVDGYVLMGDPAYPLYRPAGATHFRVTADFTNARDTGPAKFGLYVGLTPDDVLNAPTANTFGLYWFYTLPAGKGTLDWTFAVDPAKNPEYQYLSPILQCTWKSGEVIPGNKIDRFEIRYKVETAVADISCLVDEISIVHGRGGPEGQPEPSAATIEIATGPGAPLPVTVDIGAVVVITTTIPGSGGSDPVTSQRFIGRITDVSLGWDEAGEKTPDTGVGQIVAVGLMADLSRRVVGDAPWPLEPDGARIERVLTAAGVSHPLYSVDPGTVNILARDVDAKPALEVMQGVAESAGGVVWENRAGDVGYADALHRKNNAAALALDVCDISVTPSWSRNLEGLINEVSIGYGLPPEGEDQSRYTAEDEVSLAKWGRYNYALTTELAAVGDALAMGQLLLNRNAQPVWNLSGVPLDCANLTYAKTAALLGLDMHNLVNVTGLPVIGTTPAGSAMFLEGWTERLAFGEHSFELALSAYDRTAPPLTWNEVASSVTWDTVTPADMTWDGANLAPVADLGRWDDVSVSVRWNTVPAATDWDEAIHSP